MSGLHLPEWDRERAELVAPMRMGDESDRDEQVLYAIAAVGRIREALAFGFHAAVAGLGDDEDEEQRYRQRAACAALADGLEATSAVLINLGVPEDPPGARRRLDELWQRWRIGLPLVEYDTPT